jgi:dysferlin
MPHRYHDKQLDADVHTKLSFELFLPTKLYYAPPLNIRVFDNRKFGRKPLVGVHSIPNVMDFLIEERLRRDTALAAIKFGRRTFTLSGSTRRKPKGETHIAIGGIPSSPPTSPRTKRRKKKVAREQTVAQLPDPEFADQTVDWWSKYFASPHSTGSQGRNKKTKYIGNLMKIYPCALEDVPGGVFNPCEIVRPFSLTRGRGEKQKAAGIFKGDFAVFDAEGENINTKWDKLPPRENLDIVVRLYVAQFSSPVFLCPALQLAFLWFLPIHTELAGRL